MLEREGALHAVIVADWERLASAGVRSVREKVRAELGGKIPVDPRHLKSRD